MVFSTLSFHQHITKYPACGKVGHRYTNTLLPEIRALPAPGAASSFRCVLCGSICRSAAAGACTKSDALYASQKTQMEPCNGRRHHLPPLHVRQSAAFCVRTGSPGCISFVPVSCALPDLIEDVLRKQDPKQVKKPFPDLFKKSLKKALLFHS